MNDSGKKSKKLWTIVAIVISIVHLIPFYILITTAFKANNDFSSRWVLPESWSFQNFTQAWETASLGTAFFNTMVITACAAVLLIIFGSLAAYPLARLNTRLNKFVYFLFIAIMIIPPLTALVPLYQLVVDIGLMNTRTVAILNNLAAFLPLTIFLYAGFIRSTVPKELEEAAKMDGANTLMIFFRVVFPLLKPITATVLIISCVFIWNDYQFAIFFLQDKEVQTLTVALAGFFGQNQNNLNLVASAALMSMLPMTILFLFLQKYFVAGLSSGSIKG
ncbi:carbohydrate ABC transporter permease [Halobacillus sp. ACCC02827]|uniref:carbohydrate ABC transporter permease n=1 Tax=Bacillaceae TaxID=186817 RepID=UPI0003FFC6BF|nr:MULTISPECIES: carbohydrate ABC transporter permease [Bacillaceae]QHT45656.1 carbohydrate ABC transporter permease [Bacillus sp. SB49]WJE16455.1 carbohydrate ABC transporter permease [Halobacillus sp. ACCC02827]